MGKIKKCSANHYLYVNTSYVHRLTERWRANVHVISKPAPIVGQVLTNHVTNQEHSGQ
jgi:hypothetical protein